MDYSETRATLGRRHRTQKNRANNTTQSGKSLVGERGNNKIYTNNIRY